MALGLVLQQALIISTLMFLAILALWTQAGPILLLAGTLILRTESPSNCVAQCPRHALQYARFMIHLCKQIYLMSYSLSLCWHMQDCQLMPNPLTCCLQARSLRLCAAQ